MSPVQTSREVSGKNKMGGIPLVVGLLLLTRFLSLSQPAFSQQVQSVTEPRPRITVRMYDYVHAPRQVLNRAEQEASAIFGKAGIEVEWIDCPLTEAQIPRYPACAEPLGPTELVLRLLPESMARHLEHRDMRLGLALLSPDGEYSYVASVFWDHIGEAVHGRDLSLYQLLGHAVAHEIGHLLLGSVSHGRTGLMSADWGAEELKTMAQGYLLFTLEQRQRMRAGVLARLRREELGMRPAEQALTPAEATQLIAAPDQFKQPSTAAPVVATTGSTIRFR